VRPRARRQALLLLARAAAAALTLGLRAPAAGAEPIHPQARKYLERGIALYAAGKYDEAVTELRAGLLVKEHPDLWYALGQSERKRGDCVKAIDAYRAFLRSSPPAEEAKRAQANIARCEAILEPPAAPRAEAKGAPEDDAPRAKTTPDTQKPAQPQPDAGLRIVGVGVLATGGVLVGLGTYFAVRAASNWGTINDAAQRGDAWTTSLQRTYDGAETAETNATILFVAGAATAVAGGVLFYLGRPNPAPTPGAVSAPTTTFYPRTAGIELSSGRGRLTLAWQF
jgi:tetratricopeptide (TPR) repeat protein